MLCGENEEWIDGNAINVENVLCTGEASDLGYMSLEKWESGSYGKLRSVLLSVDPNGGWYESGLVVWVNVWVGEDGWLGRGGDGDGRGVVKTSDNKIGFKGGV